MGIDDEQGKPPAADDDYMGCPNCGTLLIYRDLRDRVNSCHGCGFTHFADRETTAEALERHKAEGSR